MAAQQEFNAQLAKGYDENWREVGAAGQPAFQGGWANFAGGYNTMAFRKDAMGYVHFKGSVASAAPGICFTLPVGYRPSAIAGLAASSGTAAAFVLIYPNGNVVPNVIAAQSWDGLTFHAEQ